MAKREKSPENCTFFFVSKSFCYIDITKEAVNRVFLPYSLFCFSSPFLRSIGGIVGLWVENQSLPVQQYRMTIAEVKEEREVPVHRHNSVGRLSINRVSTSTSFSRACAHYSDDALFAFTTFTVTCYCSSKNEWNSRTYAKKRRRFFRKSPTFFQKRPTFSRKSPSFLIPSPTTPKNTVIFPNCPCF